MAADKDTEKRLAALERAVKAAEDRADLAEAKAAALVRENKQLAAQAKDHQVQANVAVARMTMRGLTGEAGYDDPREKYAELKRATVKTADGRAHYFSQYPCYLSDDGKPPFVYHPAESFVSLPADRDPSVTFLPVEVVGKDPRTGRPIFAPKGTLEKNAAAAAVVDPSSQVVDDDDKTPGLTNKALNDKREEAAKAAAQRGPGSRPSDQNVG